MKKIISILICAFILMSATAFSASSDNGVYEYEIDGTEYTVRFADSNVPAEKQELIARKLVGIDDESVQSRGLGCILFGHDYVYTSTSVVTHKVRSSSPRCRRDNYDITYCEDCDDYYEETLTSSTYIVCCPVE
ncbi:MAG: hypothetical protein IJB49_05445 [Clostridia bacterium]|nr:hypothetical protein [Clostridia bacterium]